MASAKITDLFIGYFPDRVGQEFHAVMDGNAYDREFEERLYARVQNWTKLYSIILGEGCMWSYSNPKCPTFPIGAVMKAPVIESGIHEVKFGIYTPDELIN